MNFSLSELLFFFVLALMLFGPRRLPEIAREVGKMLAELKKASRDFQNQLQNELEQVNVEEERKKFRDQAQDLMKEAQSGFSIKPPEQSGVARTLGDAGLTEKELAAAQPAGAAVPETPIEDRSSLDPEKQEMKAPNVQ